MADKQEEIKKYLSRAYTLTKRKGILEREYKQKRKEVGNISISYDEIKSNNNNSMVENKVIELIKLKKDIDVHNIKIDEVKKEISCIIDKLEDETLRNLLRLRYLEFKKWEDIAYILNYTERHIRRKHNEALKEINKLINYVL